MKKLITAILVLAAIAVYLPNQPARAAVSDWQRGATIFPRWNTDYSSQSFQQSVANLKGTGANYVTLHVPLYQSNIYSTDVQTGGSTPTDQSLIDGVNYIHSQGMHVMIKFQVLPYDGQWSAYINPSDRTTWFKNYGNLVNHYAQIAQQTGAEELCLGTELISMSSATVNPSNTQNWNTLISNVRKVYSGLLTYSANWGSSGFTDEKNNIQFWNNLDLLGIAAYYNLYGDGSVTSLVSDWGGIDYNDITPFRNKWNKPVLFTELGYRSYSGAHNQPWNWWTGGDVNQQEQANDYTALFSYWKDKSYFAGVQLWDWSSDPNAGGSGDNNYTPQNKLAQGVMTDWWKNSGGGGGGGGSTSTAAFSATATVSPNPPAQGSQANFSVTVKNTGGASSGNVVDIEIYDSNGNRQFQQFFDNQQFSSGGSQIYAVNWTPNAQGSYKLEVGVFSSGWSSALLWDSNTLPFNVGTSGGGGGGGGSTSTASINVWWPSDGSSLQGVQPFKAMVNNMDISSYSMFWQVDGGSLNQMQDSNTDYPHKESLVDVSPWNWNGNGPYTLNFVAQANGSTIAQQQVKINVIH